MIPRWLRGWFVSDTRVSADWRKSHRLESTKVGVDLPTWRTPAERAAMNRVDRQRALRMVPQPQRERRVK